MVRLDALGCGGTIRTTSCVTYSRFHRARAVARRAAGGGKSWLQYEHVKSNLSPPTPPRVSLGPRGPLGPMIHHSGGMGACFGNSHYLGVLAAISRSIGYLAQIMACGAKMSPKMWATAENLTSNLKKNGRNVKILQIIKNGPFICRMMYYAWAAGGA